MLAPVCLLHRKVRKDTNSDNDVLVSVEHAEKPFNELSTPEKVKRASTDAFWTVVIGFGVVLTGIVVFVIGKELFSGDSPSGIFNRALKKCRKNDDLIVILGEPIEGKGEL